MLEFEINVSVEETALIEKLQTLKPYQEIVFHLELRVYISSEENNKYLIKVINKIKDCEYIEEKFKERLKIKFGKLMENQK